MIWLYVIALFIVGLVIMSSLPDVRQRMLNNMLDKAIALQDDYRAASDRWTDAQLDTRAASSSTLLKLDKAADQALQRSIKHESDIARFLGGDLYEYRTTVDSLIRNRRKVTGKPIPIVFAAPPTSLYQ